jgi:hypothetical protein
VILAQLSKQSGQSATHLSWQVRVANPRNDGLLKSACTVIAAQYFSRAGMENQILSIENKVTYTVYPGCVGMGSVSAMANSAKCAILRLAQEAEERLSLCKMKPDKPVTSLTDGFQA